MNQRGFTLIEVLVALFISAIVAVMAYGGLSSALQQREAIQSSAARTKDMLQFWTLLERDVLQIVAKPIRDSYEQIQPALVGGASNIDFLAFTRTGWYNPAGNQRSHMQRVNYTLQDNAIQRAMWADIDATSLSEAQTAVVLENVEDVFVRFLRVGQGARDDGLGGEWLDEWALRDPDKMLEQLPGAIEVVVMTSDWGEIRRVFEVASMPAVEASNDE
jgi:general secretion pathway protein J